LLFIHEYWSFATVYGGILAVLITSSFLKEIISPTYSGTKSSFEINLEVKGKNTSLEKQE
jgi:hypothetical protein